MLGAGFFCTLDYMIIRKLALLGVSWLLVSCISSTTISNTPTPQEKQAQQKQGLKDRLNRVMEEQNRRIDSLIATKDSRLKKDNKGKYIRPNWVSENGTPLYYTTHQRRSPRKAVKADAIGVGGTLGLDLNGEGIQIGVWDAGHVFASHDEFTGGAAYFGYQVPISIADSTAADVWDGHPTAVASMIIAKGLLESETFDIKGIAPQLGHLYSYDWNNDLSEIVDQLLTENNLDFILSNHSYGYPINDENGESIPNAFIGDYSLWSSILDNITYVFPYYLHIAAGGNDGNVAYPDQQVQGLDQLTGSTTAKNVLTVGSFSMSDDNSNVSPTSFSSAGPTNDFRIKPEITAPGHFLGAAYWDENNPEATDKYVTASGTSFSAPNAAAGIALLQQLYRRTNSTYLLGSTVKALLCHTAEDITQWGNIDITGPDVKTGYGAMNLEKAAALIQKDEEEPNTILEFDLNEGQRKTLYFLALNEGELTATLSWFDTHAEEGAQKALVNDLDLRIAQESTIYYPWKLPTEKQQPTTMKGDNNADTLEKIIVSEDLGGVYDISVSHKGNLSEGSQRASLVVSGPGIILTSKEALENSQSDGFVVTPMPAKDTFSVATLTNERFKSLRIFTLSGHEVTSLSKATFSRAVMHINVDFLSKGTYILGIETEKRTVFRKVILN